MREINEIATRKIMKIVSTAEPISGAISRSEQIGALHCNEHTVRTNICWSHVESQLPLGRRHKRRMGLTAHHLARYH